MINTETYQAGYKPRIHMASVRLAFYKATDEAKIKLNAAGRKKFVNHVVAHEIILTLDDTMALPTERMHKDVCKYIFKQAKMKGDINDYILLVDRLCITHDFGRVNYPFDQTKH